MVSWRWLERLKSRTAKGGDAKTYSNIFGIQTGQPSPPTSRCRLARWKPKRGWYDLRVSRYCRAVRGTKEEDHRTTCSQGAGFVSSGHCQSKHMNHPPSADASRGHPHQKPEVPHQSCPLQRLQGVSEENDVLASFAMAHLSIFLPKLMPGKHSSHRTPAGDEDESPHGCCGVVQAMVCNPRHN